MRGVTAGKKRECGQTACIPFFIAILISLCYNTAMNENISENRETMIPDAEPSYILVGIDNAVVFPGHLSSFNIGKASSVNALMKAVETNSEVFFTYSSTGGVSPDSVSRVGTLSRVKQLIRNSKGGLSIIASGVRRMEIKDFVAASPIVRVTLCEYEKKRDDEVLMIAMRNALRTALLRSMQLSPKLFDSEPSMDDLEEFIGEMAQIYYTANDERQHLLSLRSEYAQLEDIYAHIERYSDIVSLQKDIESKVRSSMDKSHKEYYLREQIKVLHAELGDDASELDDFRESIEAKNMPDYAKEKALKEVNKMSRMSPMSPESAVSRGYIETILALPWNDGDGHETDIEYARKVLEEDHYGLEKIKERIIEYLAVSALKKDMKAPILCFVGPPGVGKTSIVRSIARAAKRKFVSVSLGGVRDEAEIRGHRRTYIGSLPGRIISGMEDAGVCDPVFLLDEIDKMSSDYRGDPSSALLEVLDANQNDKFKDHYLDMPYDLSKVMFVTTANTVETIDAPLLDRMEIIELGGYTYNEKLQIAKRYLVPRECEANGVPENKVKFTDEAMLAVINSYTRESGVRSLQREIGSAVRKIAVKLLEEPSHRAFRITEKNLADYLGKIRYPEDEAADTDECGVVTGLAWTSAGGTSLDVEAVLLSGGKGDIRLTGNLGDVMKESAQTALTLVREHADELGIDGAAFSDCDIHVHVPEGAVPKDGPSAGVTMATAIASAMSGRKVAHDIAMTGEITLRGKVLAIGGLKEKSLAALRIGKKRLIIPKTNLKDMDDIPAEVKDTMRILPVSDIREVFAAALR